MLFTKLWIISCKGDPDHASWKERRNMWANAWRPKLAQEMQNEGGDEK